MGLGDFISDLWLSEDIARRNNLSADESFRIFCSLRCGVPLPGASGNRNAQKNKCKTTTLKEPDYYREKYRGQNLEFRPGNGYDLSPLMSRVFVNGRYLGHCKWNPDKDKA